MAQEKLYLSNEMKAIHSVLERLDATGIEECSGDWLADLQTTDFSTLMGHLPEMAANTADAELRKQIGSLSNLLYTIVMYQAEMRQLSAFLSEIHRMVWGVEFKGARK